MNIDKDNEILKEKIYTSRLQGEGTLRGPGPGGCLTRPSDGQLCWEAGVRVVPLGPGQCPAPKPVLPSEPHLVTWAAGSGAGFRELTCSVILREHERLRESRRAATRRRFRARDTARFRALALRGPAARARASPTPPFSRPAPLVSLPRVPIGSSAF